MGARRGGHFAYVRFAADARRRAEQELAYAERALRETKTSDLDRSKLRKVQRGIDSVKHQLAFMEDVEPGADQLSRLIAKGSLKGTSFLTRHRRNTCISKLARQEARELDRRGRKLRQAVQSAREAPPG